MLKLTDPLFRPIDIAPLVFFRTLGGGLIFLELLGEWLTNYKADFLHPTFHFSYQLLPWLQPWPPFWMQLHFALNAALALMLTLGLYYRISAFLLFLGLGTSLLMEQSAYINHTYLYCLLALLMGFIPAHRAYSLDVRRRPELLQATAPAWTLYLLRFQIAVVYIFAGLAKLNPDWLAGVPLNIWLPKRAEYPLIGPLFTLPWLPLLMSWAGLAIDLFIIPALLWKRSRTYAFALVCFFHLSNVIIFGIGTFPWLSIVMTALYFPAERFRRLPILRHRLPPVESNATFQTKAYPRKPVLALLGLYVFLQLAIPLRQYAYPGDIRYSEDAHNFSWHMMLRSKQGSLYFRLRDPQSGKEWKVDPNDYLTPRQYRKAIGKPDMILALAHFLRDEYQKKGYRQIEVYAYCQLKYNNRPARPFTDSRVDLAKEKRHLGVYDWVLPLQADD